MRIALFSLLALGASAIISFTMVPPKNALDGFSLYVPTQSQVAKWLAQYPNDNRGVEIKEIASQPQGIWLSGKSDDMQILQQSLTESTNQGSVPIVVLYNIPKRDCGSYSAGGATTSAAYKQWVTQVSNVIGKHSVIEIIEPDAIANSDCLSLQEQTERYSLISFATNILSQNEHAYIYIDAGHAGWQSPEEIGSRLQKAGIDHAHGFSLNVSNFFTTKDTVDYGQKIAKEFFKKKSFVVDTSRNGNGPTQGNDWCNPSGRALGETPTTKTNTPYVDALLWIKPPGESDGTCNDGPSAGTFFPQYAYEIVLNTHQKKQ